MKCIYVKLKTPAGIFKILLSGVWWRNTVQNAQRRKSHGEWACFTVFTSAYVHITQLFNVLRYLWQPEPEFKQKITALLQVHVMSVLLLHPEWAQRLCRSEGAGGRGDDSQSVRRADEVQPRPQSWEKTCESKTARMQVPVEELKQTERDICCFGGNSAPSRSTQQRLSITV